MTQLRVYKNRLLKLADFLDKLPRSRFNYASWVGKDWKGKKDLSCGTTACALGWATTMPTFRKLGLRMFVDRYDGDGYVGILSEEDEGDCYASEKIFGLGINEHLYLFTPAADAPMYLADLPRSPGHRATPEQVAKHIRRFVKAMYGDIK